MSTQEATPCCMTYIRSAHLSRVYPLQPGETREAPQDMVYVNEEGIQRHVKGIDDKLTVRQAPGPAPGKTMAILGGRHADLLCEVGSHRRCVRNQISRSKTNVILKTALHPKNAIYIWMDRGVMIPICRQMLLRKFLSYI